MNSEIHKRLKRLLATEKDPSPHAKPFMPATEEAVRSYEARHGIQFPEDGPNTEGQLTIWDSGEGELVHGGTSGRVHQTALAQLTQLTVESALSEFVRLIKYYALASATWS